MGGDEFQTVFGSAQILGATQILTSLLMSFVLASVLATAYRWTFAGMSYSRSFIHTLVLGAMITSMLIMAIGNNLARGLGILGTLAIVRFRTPIRDPRDMMFLFASLGVGIACGANTLGVAIVGTFVISGAALLLHWSPFASRREYEGMLRFMAAEGQDEGGGIDGVLKSCCSGFSLIAMREAAQGEQVEYSYQVRLLDPSYQREIVEGLNAVEGVSSTSLLMHRTTVEL